VVLDGSAYVNGGVDGVKGENDVSLGVWLSRERRATVVVYTVVRECCCLINCVMLLLHEVVR